MTRNTPLDAYHPDNCDDNGYHLGPLLVACPRCNAAPRARCTTASGNVKGRWDAHAPRWDAYQGAIYPPEAEAPDTTPGCGACDECTLGMNCRDLPVGPEHNTYPDTAGGALAYLRSECSLDLARATAKPDPVVEGVWLVDLHVEAPQVGDEVEVLVYLRGYPTMPGGPARDFNDWECLVHDPGYVPNELLNCLGL